MIVSGFTIAPGCRTTRSTWESVCAAIQRMSSGTRVPRPRTSRNIGPRFTSSVHTVARSTVGAAGRSLERASVTTPKRRTAAAHRTGLRIMLARAFDGGGISIKFYISFWHTRCRNRISLMLRIIYNLSPISFRSNLHAGRYRNLSFQYRTLETEVDSLRKANSSGSADFADVTLQLASSGSGTVCELAHYPANQLHQGVFLARNVREIDAPSPSRLGARAG